MPKIKATGALFVSARDSPPWGCSWKPKLLEPEAESPSWILAAFFFFFFFKKTRGKGDHSDLDLPFLASLSPPEWGAAVLALAVGGRGAARALAMFSDEDFWIAL